jgi:TetR/AcrR family transcriptional regulator, ethionamide resistance regulator
MRNIAVAAGIARSTAYRYFPRKNCLLIRLVDADTGDRFAPAERWWEHWRPGDNTGLTAGLAAAIEFRRRRGHLLAALAEVAAYDTLVARYHAGRTARMTELIVASLQQVHAAGDGPPPVVDPAVGVIVAAMVERTADLYSTLESPIDLRRIATALSKAVTAVATGI